jgi:osmotically-inducible protein OsmY
MANLTDELTIRLSEKLERDKRTGDSQIEVINESGVITLTGNADSHAARDAAFEIANSEPGIVSVFNDIIVRGDDGSGGQERIVPLPLGPLGMSQ